MNLLQFRCIKSIKSDLWGGISLCGPYLLRSRSELLLAVHLEVLPAQGAEEAEEAGEEEVGHHVEGLDLQRVLEYWVRAPVFYRNLSKREKTVSHKYLQEACFVLINLRKYPETSGNSQENAI